MNTKISAAFLFALALAASAVSASIVNVSGFCQQISPPSSCVWGAQTGMTAFAWNEQVGVTPSSGVLVDMTNNPGSSSSPIPGLLMGTFDSHFIHFDGIPGVIGATGSVTFSGQIIGCIFTQPLLDLSDPTFGSGGTTYPTGYPFRGLNTQSSFSINNNVLTFNFFSMVPTNDVIQVRVLTHTPTPGAATSLGMAGLVALRRRRK